MLLPRRPPTGSIVAGDQAQLRCWLASEINLDIVDEAPAPAFRRIVSLNDRMPGGVEVVPGVTMGRTVAAADMAAGSAQAEVNPLGADGQALGTAPRARGGPG
jgi:hypothetical protein